MVLNLDDVSINALTGIFPSTRQFTNIGKILFNDVYYNQKIIIIYSEFYHVLINNIMASTTTKATIDSDTNWSTITEEFAKKLGVEIIGNSHESQNNSVVSSIVKQVSNKKIWISLRQLLEIVKPEIRQEIINSITNPDISQRNRTPCKAKRIKLIFNDIASESSSGSGSDSESV